MFKRLMSALVGFPLVVLLLLFGNQLAIDITFSIISIICLTEFYGTFKEKNIKPIKWLGYALSISIAFMHVISNEYLLIALKFVVPFIVSVLFIQVILTNMKTTIQDISVTLLGIFYVIGFIIFVPFIRSLDGGESYIWYIIFASWGTDVFAYFVGMLIGKHKFTQISPKKSIEGCIGGIIGSVIICYIYTYYLNAHIGLNIDYMYIIIISIIFSIFRQIGDLAASSIKRYNEIKDFGDLIPGHGGLLDRIDSMIFIAPIVYFVFYLI